MEKCQICGRNAIVRIGEVWLCEKKECHEKFFSVEEILRKAGITPTAVMDRVRPVSSALANCWRAK